MFTSTCHTRRQRNPHTHDEKAGESPFFSNAAEKRNKQQNGNAFFQAKMAIGKPNDKYEKEADSVAQAVTNQKNGSPILQKVSGIQRLATPVEDEKLATNDARMRKDKEIQEKPIQAMGAGEEKKEKDIQKKDEHDKEEEKPIQKKEGPVKEEEKPVQKKDEPVKEEEKKKQAPVQAKQDTGGATASPHLSSRIESSAGKGKQLPAKTLREMNGSFGADFSNVRVHTDQEAVGMNKELQSQAFTRGNDIYFNEGKLDTTSSAGKFLLAHELTHVVQQGASEQDSLQRSCNDGKCDSCIGGMRDFWITFYFRRRANEKTMKTIRDQINGAKAVLKNCCLNLKAEFDWRLLAGGNTFTWDKRKPGGGWTYSDDAVKLGTGNTFAGSKGIPVLVVDHVPGTGGGATMSTSFDATYSGATYVTLGINDPAFLSGCNALAHELWHVAGNLPHSTALGGTVAECTGNDVNEKYCRDLRNVVAPMGDFPTPKKGTAVA